VKAQAEVTGQWGQVRDHILGHWVADFGHGPDGLLQVDCVPETDGRDRPVEAAGFALLFFAGPISD
jgi:hypothetical protein